METLAAQDRLAESALQPIAARGGLKGSAIFLFLRFLAEAERDPKSKFQVPETAETHETEASERRGAFRKLSATYLPGMSEGRIDAARAGAAFGQHLLQRAAELGEIGTLPGGFNVSLAFTWKGLAALGLCPETLASFPEPFQEGMAARATSLGDTGENAPEHWDGYLGTDMVHGLVIISGDPKAPSSDPLSVLFSRDKSEPTHGSDAERRALRRAVAQFNAHPLMSSVQAARFAELGTPAKALVAISEGLREDGIEILQVEIGEDPYRPSGPEPGAPVHPVLPRIEHFGYRDGISQPFILTDGPPKPPPPGGGRPMADGSWAPVAPGELFLGHPDEDGEISQRPANVELRHDGTYLVFRKLEQDVTAFQRYLDTESAGKDYDSEWLAARMMGRWRSGASVTRHPDHDGAYGDDATLKINDFTYRNDAHGLVCPIGAHIRRVNPRDHHDGETARRHRVLRRSISYGGALIAEPEQDDGTPRGMFFMAIGARIDLQFELMQRDWIQGGELFSQAGAGKCPITGAHGGDVTDHFHDGVSIAAHTHLPRFVTLKGGDYFFLPSRPALARLAEQIAALDTPSAGAPDTSGKPCLFSADDGHEVDPAPGAVVETPALFDPDRVRVIGEAILRHGLPGLPALQPPPAGAPPPDPLRHGAVRRFRLKQRSREGGTPRSGHLVFVAKYDDVTHIQNHADIFTTEHYHRIGLELGGERVIIGERGNSEERKERLNVLHTAMFTLGMKLAQRPVDEGLRNMIRGTYFLDLPQIAREALHAAGSAVHAAMAEIARSASQTALARLRQTGRIDLLQDLGFFVPYIISDRLYGLKGPDWLTPIAISARFAKSSPFEAPRQWFETLEAAPRSAAPYITLQTWTRFSFAEIFTNIVRYSELTGIARQAYDEFNQHLRHLFETERRAPSGRPTLVGEFVANRRLIPDGAGGARETDDELAIASNLKQGILSLTDLMGAHMVNIGPPFGKIMDFLLRQPTDMVDFIDHHRQVFAAARVAGTHALPPGDVETAFYNQFIDECLRFRPAGTVQFRIARKPSGDDTPPAAWRATLPSGGAVADGDIVAMMVSAANMDPLKFAHPQDFDITRDPGDYIAFGGTPAAGASGQAVHHCWGKPIGRVCLREMIKAAETLPGLRRIAGPEGEMANLVGLPYSLKARFAATLF